MNNIHLKKTIDLYGFHRIDINLYPVFIAIYDFRSITLAARALCITQSALSHALKRLRLALKDELFIRQGRQMQPTAFAMHIYPQIFAALESLQKISSLNQAFDPTSIQSLNIAVHHEIEPLIFPKLVQHFQTLCPDLKCNSLKLDRKTLIQDLKSYQLDFAIDLEQQFFSKLEFVPLLKDEFVVCTQMTKMDENLYYSSSHIGVSSRRNGILFEDIYLPPQSRHRKILLRCQHYSTAFKILVDHPNAILTLPRSVLTRLNHDSYFKDLQVFDFPTEVQNMSFGLYFFNERQLDERLIFFKNEITKIFA